MGGGDIHDEKFVDLQKPSMRDWEGCPLGAQNGGTGESKYICPSSIKNGQEMKLETDDEWYITLRAVGRTWERKSRSILEEVTETGTSDISENRGGRQFGKEYISTESNSETKTLPALKSSEAWKGVSEGASFGDERRGGTDGNEGVARAPRPQKRVGKAWHGQGNIHTTGTNGKECRGGLEAWGKSGGCGKGELCMAVVLSNGRQWKKRAK